MPCAARIFQEGSCYYIKSRSLKKERMFNSDDDYDKYIRLLNKYKVRFGIFIYGFCLCLGQLTTVRDYRYMR